MVGDLLDVSHLLGSLTSIAKTEKLRQKIFHLERILKILIED